MAVKIGVPETHAASQFYVYTDLGLSTRAATLHTGIKAPRCQALKVILPFFECSQIDNS